MNDKMQFKVGDRVRYRFDKAGASPDGIEAFDGANAVIVKCAPEAADLPYAIKVTGYNDPNDPADYTWVSEGEIEPL